MVSVKDVEAAVKEYDKDKDRYEKFYNDISEGGSLDLSVGTAEHVEADREDSKYYVVFKIGDEHFEARTDYDSWEGVEWDYCWVSKVEPVEVKVTQWRSVKD